MRPALALLALAFPLAALAQPTHTVTDGAWVIVGTPDDDTVDFGCTGGFAQLNGSDPADGPTACAEIIRIDVSTGDGIDLVTFNDIEQFDLDRSYSGTIDTGAGIDIVQMILDYPVDDIEVVVETTGDSDAVSVRVSDDVDDLLDALIDDRDVTLNIRTGAANDRARIKLSELFSEMFVKVSTGAGDDEVDGTESTVAGSLSANLGIGNDLLIAGSLNTSSVWTPGDGTDRHVGGPGHNEIEIIGGDARLGIHKIKGFLDSECAFFDFQNGGGIIDEGIDAASFFPGDGGIDLFTEIECSVAEETWLAGGGPDHTFLRGRADGGSGLDLDFEFDTAIFTDGFESGDVSSWASGADATGRGGAPWDGIDYQDWPSFTDPSTSGPSTVTIHGRPDFPVTIDLGPDDGTGRAVALDSLLIDPMGLSVDDDGSRIVIGGGPPITYRGVDVLQIADPPPPTAAEDGPDGVPTLTASPNPSARGTHLRLDGAVPGTVRVAVFDALGRRVAVLHDGPARADHAWDLAAGRLAPGVYVVRATGAVWAASRTVVVAE